MAIKSKAKVNTKFVLILISVVGATLVLLGGLWMLRQRADATRNLVRAQQAIDRGDWDAALLQIARAIHKEPTKSEYLRQMEDILAHMRPTTQDRATELHTQLLQILQHDTTYRSEDAEVHMRLIRELYDCARFLESPPIWEELASVATRMETNLRDDDPRRPEARLYYGMSRMQLRTRLTPDEVVAAAADIQAYVDANPTSDLGWGRLVLSQLQIYEDLQNRGERNRAAEHLAKVDALLAKAIAASPDGLEVATVHAMRAQMAAPSTSGPRATAPGGAQGDPVRVQAALDHLARAMAGATTPGTPGGAGDPLQLSLAALLMNQLGGDEGGRQAIRLVQPYLQAHPDRIDVCLRLALLHQRVGDVDQADHHATMVLESEPLPVSYLSRFQILLREQAGGVLVDSAFFRWEAADESIKPQLVARIEEARNRTAAQIPQPDGNPTLTRADGKLAYAKGQYELAAKKFEDVVGLTQRLDPEALIYSAMSLDRIKQTGLAIERMNQALQLRPRQVALWVELARMQANLRRHADLKLTLDNIRRLDPENADAAKIAAFAAETDLSAAQVRGVRDDEPFTPLLKSAQAAQDAGDVAAARTILLDARQKYPTALPVFEALYHLEVKAGRTDAAKAVLHEALLAHPDNVAIKRGLLAMEIADPVERVIAAIDADPQLGNDRDRAVSKAVTLLGLSRSQRLMAQSLQDQGQLEPANGARDVARRARERAEDFRKAVVVDGQDHPRVLDYLYSQALVDQDWAAAEQMMPKLIEMNADQADGLIIRGRYDLAKGDDAAAARTLAQAVARKDYSSDGWRLLGLAYMRLGNMTEAQRSFESAFQRNPNDPELIKLYVELLVRVGDQPRALRVLRQANQMTRQDALIREGWLDMEAAIGDRAAAITERRERYRSTPTDLVNASAFARLLAEAQPDYRHVVDETGKPRFTAERWLTMAVSDQQRYITETKSAWIGESEKIVKELAAASGGQAESLELVSLQAMLKLARGQSAAGETLIREWIKRQAPGAPGGGSLTATPFLALADYQRRIGRSTQEIIATLEEARPYQSAAAHEVDRQIADLLSRAGRSDEALAVYDRVVQASPEDRSVQILAIESLMRTGRHDDALLRLKRLVDRSGEDFSSMVLRAMLLDAQAAALIEQQKVAEGERLLAEVFQVLEAARRLEPNNPVALMQKAKSMIACYRRTKEQRYFDEASMALGEAEKLRADFGPAMLLRADLWLAKQDAGRAIQEMERYVKIDSGSVEGRETLINLYAGQGNVAKAMEVATEGTRLNPTVALWWEVLGNLRFDQKDWKGAAEALARAHDLQPSDGLLGRLVACLLAKEPPDHLRTIEYLTRDSSTVEKSPLMRGLYAVALHHAGRKDEALEQIRMAYRGYRQGVLQESQRPDLIATWFISARQMFAPAESKKLEALFLELCDNKPDLYECQSMGMAWAGAGKDGLSSAIEWQRKAIAMCPPENTLLLSDLHGTLVPYCMRAQDFQGAADSLQQVVKHQPNNANALNDLAYLLATVLNDPQSAQPFARRVVDLHPNNAAILDTMATVLEKLGQNAEAEQYFDRALKADAPPEIYLHHAQFMRKLNRTAEAERSLKRAFELSKPGDEVRQQITAMQTEIKTKK